MVLAEFIKRFSHIPAALQISWTAAPGSSVAGSALLIVQGMLPVATLYVTKRFIDDLVVVIGADARGQLIRPTLFWLATLVILLLLTDVFKSVYEWIRTAQAEYIHDHINMLLHEQALKLDISFYESTAYYDHLEQARGEAAGRVRTLLDSGSNLVQSTVTLLGMAAVLTQYGYWLPFAMLITLAPSFYVLLRYDRLYHKWWSQSTEDRRRANYYDLLLTHQIAAPEIRLFGLGKYFQSLHQALRLRLRNERLRQLRSKSVSRLVASTMSMLGAGLIMGWMLWRAFLGQVTLGDLALFYQAINRGQALMRGFFESVGNIYSSNLFLGHLFTFLSLKGKVAEPAEPLSPPDQIKEGIRFKNVTFRYPGSDTPTLKNFDLFIPPSKIVAIVGTNGAGKTTLAKLLCRFYDPEEGTIDFDGTDIRRMPLKSLWRSITVLFQFPLHYQMTARQNIGFGDTEKCDISSDVESAARKAGAHEFVSRLPKGYETKLGKQFSEGAELSGGEWQRIALARAYLRKAPLMILDEPTSAMDSWGEASWFNDFRELAEGRTAVVITHRFTIAMRADIIYVMNKGEIIEKGSHAELLKEKGMYAKSWSEQMQVTPDYDGTELPDDLIPTNTSIVKEQPSLV